MSICDTCKDPGACCRGLQVSHLFDEKDTRKEVLEWLKANELEMLDPMRPAVYYATWGSSKVVKKKWSFSCKALGEDGRCTIYENRPEMCREYAPQSDPLCVHYEGPWKGWVRRLPSKKQKEASQDDSSASQDGKRAE